MPGEAQPEVAVGDSLHGIGDGLIKIVAFDQNGIETGHRAALASASALEQFGQEGEYARWISLGRRRLLRGQADLPLGMTEACERVHEQQNIVALIAKIFSHGCGNLGSADTQERRVIAGALEVGGKMLEVRLRDCGLATPSPWYRFLEVCDSKGF